MNLWGLCASKLVGRYSSSSLQHSSTTVAQNLQKRSMHWKPNIFNKEAQLSSGPRQTRTRKHIIQVGSLGDSSTLCFANVQVPRGFQKDGRGGILYDSIGIYGMGRGMRSRRNVTCFLLIVNNDIKFLLATIFRCSAQTQMQGLSVHRAKAAPQAMCPDRWSWPSGLEKFDIGNEGEMLRDRGRRLNQYNILWY